MEVCWSFSVMLNIPIVFVEYDLLHFAFHAQKI